MIFKKPSRFFIDEFSELNFHWCLHVTLFSTTCSMLIMERYKSHICDLLNGNIELDDITVESQRAGFTQYLCLRVYCGWRACKQVNCISGAAHIAMMNAALA